MTAKTAYQYAPDGLLQGITDADESPLEPGVYLLPARATLLPPPDEIPADQWPRWNGQGWHLVNRPIAAEIDPLTKLREFLAANPDVSAIL